jgi:hypothetical protein
VHPLQQRHDHFEHWRVHPAVLGLDDAGVSVGAHYLEVCCGAVREGTPQSSEVLLGIEGVLYGERRGFAFESFSTPPRPISASCGRS